MVINSNITKEDLEERFRNIEGKIPLESFAEFYNKVMYESEMRENRKKIENDLKSQIAGRIRLLRKIQINKAYLTILPNLYDKNTTTFPSTLGLMLNNNILGKVAGEIAKKVSETDKLMGMIPTEWESIEWFLSDQNKTDTMLAGNLYKYAKRYRMTNPERIMKNSKAWIKAISNVYGDVNKGTYKINGQIDTLKKIVGRLYDFDEKQIIKRFNESLSEIPMIDPVFGIMPMMLIRTTIIGFYYQFITENENYRKGWCNFADSFLDKYKHIRLDELERYHIEEKINKKSK